MTGRFDISPTRLAGLHTLSRKPRGDARGYFERMFCLDDLGALLAGRAIVQINHTLTVRRGTVRGMHFQRPPFAESKLVSCLRGEVFDVAVDLRRGSPTSLAWHGEVLSAANHKTLFIPEGFAHGFQTLTDDCELLYLHTAPYNAEAEGGVSALDPRLAIAWPLPPEGLSARDMQHPAVSNPFEGIVV